MNRAIATLLIVAFTFATFCAFVPSADALVKGFLHGKIVEKGYTATGHVCPNKPWWLPMPGWLWHHLTCARTAS